MSRYKRTYTFEQYVTAWVDAALSSIPPDARQEIRSPVLQAYLAHEKYSILARRRLYTAKEYAWAVAWGLNSMGPALQRSLNKYGIGNLAKWIDSKPIDVPPAITTEDKVPCQCPSCMSGAMHGLKGHTF